MQVQHLMQGMKKNLNGALCVEQKALNAPPKKQCVKVSVEDKTANALRKNFP